MCQFSCEYLRIAGISVSFCRGLRVSLLQGKEKGKGGFTFRVGSTQETAGSKMSLPVHVSYMYWVEVQKSSTTRTSSRNGRYKNFTYRAAPCRMCYICVAARMRVEGEQHAFFCQCRLSERFEQRWLWRSSDLLKDAVPLRLCEEIPSTCMFTIRDATYTYTYQYVHHHRHHHH